MDTITVNYDQMADDYQRVEQAILFLEANQQRQPGLKEVAESVGLSEYHFQRLFTRWVGISPKRFLQYLTKEQAKALLEGSGDLLRAAYETGLSSPGRLHELFISCEAVTPGEYKRQGEGIEISYGVHPTPFGECLLALLLLDIRECPIPLLILRSASRPAARNSSGPSSPPRPSLPFI